MKRRFLMTLMLWMLGLAVAGAWAADGATGAVAPADFKWWEKREERRDIRYPHNAHMAVMEKEGDSCMLCHSFRGTEVSDDKTLTALTTIANEPLKAICHDCHVVENRAPWRCELCHDDKTRIWPADHNFGYIEHHGETARRDEAACRECHLDLTFCTDCHFRRDTRGTGYHPLAYRSLHGIEARMMPSNCARCHNTPYCDECHRAN